MNDRVNADEVRGHYTCYLLIFASLLLIVAGQILGKMGSGSIYIGGFSIRQLFTPLIILAYLCLIVQGLVWILVVKRFDLSFAYPFMSLSYVLILAFSYVFFDEAVTPMKVVGSVFITVGVAVIFVGKKRGEGDD